MVGPLVGPPLGLGSTRSERHSLVNVTKHKSLPVEALELEGKGLDVREVLLLPRREKCFLLTSPFIEPG